MGNMMRARDLRDTDGAKVAHMRIGSFREIRDGEHNLPAGEKIRLFITDPPYNLNFDYGEDVDDNLPPEEYHQLMIGTFRKCFEVSDIDASLFIIHYPEAIAALYTDLIDIGWEVQQWISWVYPSNTGHSDNKWSRSHRTILWLKKGNPPFYSRAVTQNFKNPSVKVIQEKKEQGVLGVSLYDWWEIPQVKNINSEHAGYSNQIPEELIRRIVLCASNPLDWVADPFSGTYSTMKTALKLGRRGWGCDLNSATVEFWPENNMWQPRNRDPVLPNVDASQLDQILEIITLEHYQRAAYRMIGDATEEDLKKYIGPKNGPRVFEALK